MAQQPKLTAAMRACLTAGALGVAAVVLPSAPQARGFVAYQSTTPLLYSYAACVFDTDGSGVEQTIEGCAPLKAALLEQSKAVIANFHSSAQSVVERELKKGFRAIERDAVQAQVKRKPVPASTVAYLKCMSTKVMATDGFNDGSVIDYIGIEEACETQVKPETDTQATKQQLARERLLYDRFRRSGRLTYPHNLALRAAHSKYRGRLRPQFRMRQGFLDLGPLPSDKKNEE